MMAGVTSPMTLAYDRLLRPGLYAANGHDAETVHHRTLAALAAAARVPGATAAATALARVNVPVDVLGIRFPNRVGLAAGMDKDGRALDAWPALGFGFVEVGTVTRHAQPGNPRPRMFALDASDAVLNRMGFNNAGADALADRLAAHRPDYPLGISLGKSKVTPLADAVEDYRYSFARLAPFADYVAVNVSSPNTPGLRELQDKSALADIVSALVADSRTAGSRSGRPVPVLVKVAPDLTFDALADVLDVIAEHGAAGVIATNTTLSREGLAPADARFADEAGGLSGSPLRARSREVVAFLREQAPDLPIIGVGGISCAEDALAMMDAGADLVQVYSAFVLHGPALVRECALALSTR